MGTSFKVRRIGSALVLTWALFVGLSTLRAEGTPVSNAAPAPAAHDSGAFLCPTQPQYVRANGSTDIDFGTAAPIDDKTASLKVSTFISKDQEVGDIGFNGTAPGEPLQPELSSYPIAGPHLTPPLLANDLTPGTSYTGTLWITVGDHKVTACGIELVMPKYPRGELRSDRPSVSRAVMLRMWFGDPDDAHASFILSEKDGRRVDAVSAMLEGASAAPSGTFDPAQFVTFFVNGMPNPRFMESSPSNAAPRDAAKAVESAQAPPIVIARNRQLGIGMQFHSLSAGQYAFSLRLSAANVAVPGPKIDVTFTVRHHWIWAVLAVLLALALSFFISKGIVNWRERMRIRARIAQLEVERFDDHASLSSVVFLRAVLDQSTQLVATERMLPPPPSVYDYLTRADRVVTIIRRYSLLKHDLDACSCLDSVKFHYNQAIADIMRRIGPQPLDQKTTDGIVEDLAAINSRLTDPDAWYWATLKTKATLLAKQAQELRGEFGTQTVVDDWLGKLENFPAAQDRSVDQAFWMVNLLYSRREFSDDISALIQRYIDTKSLTETFKLADDLAWKRLTQAAANKALRIVRMDDSDSPETLSPTKFLLHFDDPGVGESYLVSDILKYQWQFDLAQAHKPGRSRRKEPQSRRWTVATNGPRVTQYAPFAGHLKVSVTIRRITAAGVEQIELPALSVSVIENTELALVKALDGSELFLMGIIAAVALVTSIPALYLAKPTFGSFADYIAILAWAIGIDQGKNLVQLMKTFPADAPT
jgi:hypothetical protein